jgi:hypothetical protein
MIGRRFFARALVAVVVTAAALVPGVGAHAQTVSIEPDAAYCPYGFVNGYGNWTPGVTVVPQPNTFTIQLTAQCFGFGDEAGILTTWNISMSGTSFEDCGAGEGAGSMVLSNGVETIASTFTLVKGGIHYYVDGSLNVSTGGAETHDIQLWLDILPSASSACFYNSGQIIGHGAITDSGIGQ